MYPCLWFIFVLFDLFFQYFFNSINDVVIEDLILLDFKIFFIFLTEYSIE
jgi:hypothetical protein